MVIVRVLPHAILRFSFSFTLITLLRSRSVRLRFHGRFPHAFAFFPLVYRYYAFYHTTVPDFALHFTPLPYWSFPRLRFTVGFYTAFSLLFTLRLFPITRSILSRLPFVGCGLVLRFGSDRIGIIVHSLDYVHGPVAVYVAYLCSSLHVPVAVSDFHYVLLHTAHLHLMHPPFVTFYLCTCRCLLLHRHHSWVGRLPTTASPSLRVPLPYRTAHGTRRCAVTHCRLPAPLHAPAAAYTPHTTVLQLRTVYSYYRATVTGPAYRCYCRIPTTRYAPRTIPLPLSARLPRCRTDPHALPHSFAVFTYVTTSFTARTLLHSFAFRPHCTTATHAPLRLPRAPTLTPLRFCLYWLPTYALHVTPRTAATPPQPALHTFFATPRVRHHTLPTTAHVRHCWVPLHASPLPEPPDFTHTIWIPFLPHTPPPPATFAFTPRRLPRSPLVRSLCRSVAFVTLPFPTAVDSATTPYHVVAVPARFTHAFCTTHRTATRVLTSTRAAVVVTPHVRYCCRYHFTRL